MGDEDRKLLETVLERGFERMETRFDALASQIHEHGTAIAVIQTNCVRHLTDDEKRDKRISSLYRVVGEKEREVSQVTAKPSASTVPDLIAVLDAREDALGRRLRTWAAIGLPVLLAVLATPVVRGCLGEAQTERIAASVKVLEDKPAQKVTVLPAGPPTIVIVKPDVEVK